MNQDLEITKKRFPAVSLRSLWFWLFAVLLVLNLTVVGFDLYPKVQRKIGRIGLGTIPPAEYERQVRTAAVARLKVLPPIKFSDESRLRVLDYVNPISFHEKWSYALLSKGVADALRQEPNPEELKILVAYGDTIVDSQGRFLIPYNGIETASQGISLLFLAEHAEDSRYRKAADAIAEHYLALYQKTGHPLNYYCEVSNSPSHLALVDTIGLLCPFLMEYYAVTGRREVMEMAVAHIDEYFKHGIEPITGFPHHALNRTMDFAPSGFVGWGREFGWLALGFADTLPSLPAMSPERERLAGYARQIAASAIRFQRSEGGWGTILSSEDSQFDSGCTAMITYFLLRCRNEGVTLPDMDEAISHAIEALRSKTRRNGTLDFCQGPVVAENRHSRLWEPTSFGQGLLLSALVQDAIYKVKTKHSLPEP